jgi:hypothetical protein
MAVKNFGVKQVNLIGASGTPTIESPNNININAVNVAISTDMSVGGSVGISSNITVTGIVTASSFSGDGSGLTGVASTDNIQTATSANFLSNVNIAGITTCQALTVSGNLTVDGTTTTINSTTLTVDDKTIVIASGAADSSAADGAGISIDGASATILYSHSGTKFVSNKPFEATSFTGDVTGNADTANTLQNARTIAGVSFDGSANISLNNNAITNGAGYITSSGTAALAQGLTGTPNLNVGVITATTFDGTFTGDGTGLTGVSAGSTDNIQTATVANFLDGITVAGITTATNQIALESDDGTPGRLDFYCESSNAHYTRLQSQAHANYSGNVTVTLPKVTGTAIVGGSNSNDTNITTTGNVSATNFNSTSDVTLKQDVSAIDNALKMISQLEGVSWRWKETLKPSLGVIAQNVEEVAPELVSNGSHKSVNYNGLIGILIEAVKELKSEVDELKR